MMKNYDTRLLFGYRHFTGFILDIFSVLEHFAETQKFLHSFTCII